MSLILQFARSRTSNGHAEIIPVNAAERLRPACRQPTQNLTFHFLTLLKGMGAGAREPLTAAANHPRLA
jgi:hypothetical protein